MELKQLNSGLERAFKTDGNRIVFWYDAEADFESDLSEITLEKVNIVNMRNESAFGMKLRLERDDPEGRYLLYFPAQESDFKKNWLLDIQIYSHCFYADRSSMVLQELGIENPAIRQHLLIRETFLANKQRINSLKAYIRSDATEQDIDSAMIASTVRADQSDISSILFAMANQFAAIKDVHLNSCFPELDVLGKFGLMPSFFHLLQHNLGYKVSTKELSGETGFSYGRFLLWLFATDFCSHLDTIPAWATEYVYPDVNAISSVKALLSGWRDSHKYYKAYDVLSELVANELDVCTRINDLSAHQLVEVETFSCVEKDLIVEISQAIPGAVKEVLEDYQKLIAVRKDRYWASRHHDDEKRRKFNAAWLALSAANALFLLRKKYESGFYYDSVKSMHQAYVTELHLFDTYYRHFCHNANLAAVDILKALAKAVEGCYSNWYLDQLSKSWGDRLEAEKLLSEWKILGVSNQQDFYAEYIEPILAEKKSKRVVVIISDAFRYEAAGELANRLNEKRYCEASLSNQLGVLPSYTTLGMASLLPHDRLAYKAGSDDVLVDGVSSAGTESRNKILGKYDGIAIQAEELKKWNRDTGRDAIKGKSLIYVYHNVVDARGDSASTESETFAAVEDAITELSDLVRKVLMTLNTSTVLVTSDHGFIYQQEKLSAEDRTKIEKPEHVIKSKKRYVVGNEFLQDSEQVWSGDISTTAGTSCSTRFWIPKGANRFHFVGGARFIHGGAMPQEIVVPIIQARALRGQKVTERTRYKVGVISAKSSLKMVNSIQNFELLQTDAVTDQFRPITVSVGIFDAEKLVSSEERLTFDSSSDSISDRVKAAKLSLLGHDFDRKTAYFLVISDADNRLELARYPVVIDLSYKDDFF